MQTGLADGSPLRDRLILVVGARRSGTNWIGRIIASHPAVAYLPSETFLFAHLDELTGHFQHASMGSLQVGTFYSERSTLLRGLRQLADTVLVPVLEVGRADRLLERTPDHCRNLSLIGEIYPDARVVHIIRDGRDVARSLGSMRWAEGRALHGAEEWVESVSGARRAGASMAHYRELRYEDLLADPRAEVTALFDWLDLDADEELVERALLEAEVPYNHDPTMPAITTEKWREGLTGEDLAAVEAVAGELLTELGYELAGSPSPTAPREMSVEAEGRPVGERVSTLVRGSLRSLLRRTAPDEGAEPEHSPFHWAQHTVDQFLGAVRSGHREEALGLIGPQVHVHVVSKDEEWDGRGEEVAVRLIDVLSDDDVVMGAQSRSDVHPSIPAFTLVMAGGDPDDQRWRTLVLGVRDRQIVRAAFYTHR